MSQFWTAVIVLLLGQAFILYGAWQAHEREHRSWLRNETTAACAEFLAAAYALIGDLVDRAYPTPDQTRANGALARLRMLAPEVEEKAYGHWKAFGERASGMASMAPADPRFLPEVQAERAEVDAIAKLFSDHLRRPTPVPWWPRRLSRRS